MAPRRAIKASKHHRQLVELVLRCAVMGCEKRLIARAAQKLAEQVGRIETAFAQEFTFNNGSVYLDTTNVALGQGDLKSRTFKRLLASYGDDPKAHDNAMAEYCRCSFPAVFVMRAPRATRK
ncbi:hypothetical protein sos41_31620 [Alphaproteobacteria bacterium SO-S41]|nr:hypothetical protein sos41_31620 [Alphaproteobacteria bacterium SO-S41]